MAELENIKAVVNHMALQTAIAVKRALIHAKAEPQLPTVASHKEPKRQRNIGTVL